MSDLAWLGQSDVADVTGATVLHNLDDMTRADWLHARKSGLGGSDAAAILGVSPWTSGYTLWRDKTSDHTDDQSSLAMRRGTHLEPFILAEAMVVDPDLTVYRAPYMLAHPDHPHLRARGVFLTIISMGMIGIVRHTPGRVSGRPWPVGARPATRGYTVPGPDPPPLDGGVPAAQPALTWES